MKVVICWSSPANKNEFAGALPENKNEFAGAVPKNKNEFAGAAPANKIEFDGVVPGVPVPQFYNCSDCYCWSSNRKC